MGISEVGLMEDPAWHGTKKVQKGVGSGAAGFMEAVMERAGQEEKDFNEKAFGSVGANAPEEVKKAWLEAAKEIGANGLGMSGNGMLTHISEMMAQRMKDWINGTGRTNDLLGSTVQSAIMATEQALYDLGRSSSAGGLKSMDVQRMREKEREFYLSFLEKLNALL